MPGAAPALTLEDSSVLDDEEFQLHAGRLQQLLHVQPGTGLVLLLHLPGAARGALWDTHLQVSPWRGTGESRPSALGGGMRRGNQIRASVWSQLQIDDISGICPEQAAWPKERMDKAEPRLQSSGSWELGLSPSPAPASAPTDVLVPSRGSRASPCCALAAHSSERHRQAGKMEWEVGNGDSIWGCGFRVNRAMYVVHQGGDTCNLHKDFKVIWNVTLQFVCNLYPFVSPATAMAEGHNYDLLGFLADFYMALFFFFFSIPPTGKAQVPSSLMAIPLQRNRSDPQGCSEHCTRQEPLQQRLDSFTRMGQKPGDKGQRHTTCSGISSTAQWC